MKIDLVPGQPLPIRRPPILLSPEEKQELQEHIKEQLEKGWIIPLKSPVAAPVFYTGKKDGGRYLVIDYRQLNLITIPDLYLIPTMKRLMDEIEKADLFTTLDLRGGYNNIRVRKGDEWKAAFRTFEGEYKPRVMQFGQVNAPAAFQQAIDELLKDLLGKMVLIYLDNILIYTKGS